MAFNICESDCTHFAPSAEQVVVSFDYPSDKKLDTVEVKIKDCNNSLIFSQTIDKPSTKEFKWNGKYDNGVDADDNKFVNPTIAPFDIELKGTFSTAKALTVPPDDISNERIVGAATPCPLTQQSTNKQKQEPVPEEQSQEANKQNDTTQDIKNIQVEALYRSLELTPLTWSEVYLAVSEKPNTNKPAAADLKADKLLWMQYKLNDIGIPAGALVKNPDEALLKKALFKFTNLDPTLPTIHDFATIDSGTEIMDQLDWFNKWSLSFGSIDQICAAAPAPNSARVLQRLEATASNTYPIMETPHALSGDNQVNSRLVLEHNNFYINKDFLRPDGHFKTDKLLLNHLVLPVGVKILLLSKDDADGTSNGIDSPNAIGPAQCEWMIIDPPEDLGIIPHPVDDKDIPDNFKTKSRLYVSSALRKLSSRVDDIIDAGDNCPSNLGGNRIQGNLSKHHFAKIDTVFDQSAHASKYLSVSHNNLNKMTDLLGKTGVQFTSSYIAGDNYVLRAQLSFENLPNKTALEIAHNKLVGLKKAFAPYQPTDLELDDDIPACTVQTGVLTIWRKINILQELIWSDQDLNPINWPEVIDSFEPAHIIMEPPSQAPISVLSLFSGSAYLAERRRVSALIADLAINSFDASKPDEAPHRAELSHRRDQAIIREGGLFPFPYLSFEAYIRHYNGSSTQNIDIDKKIDDYLHYLKKLDAWPSYDNLIELSKEIRIQLEKKINGKGLIVLRAQYMPTPDFSALIPRPILRSKNTQRKIAEFGFSKKMATGMDYGVVCLDTLNHETYTDKFFVSHEIGHCLFLGHPFEAKDESNHDDDKNCVMRYPGAGYGGRGSFGAGLRHFQDSVKVTLVMRKGQNGLRLTKYAKLKGKFNQKADDGNQYAFEGTAKKAIEAIKSLEIERVREAPDNQEVVVVINVAAGERHMLINDDIVFEKQIKPTNIKTKYFENVNIIAPEPSKMIPRFCGKCLMKLRGWKVYGGATRKDPVAADQAPQDHDLPIPCKPVMTFVHYEYLYGSYKGVYPNSHPDKAGDELTVPLLPRATDPNDPSIPLGPLRFIHLHRLTWQSSDGNLNSLRNVATREKVKFNRPTQLPPFSEGADPDQYFAQIGSDGEHGFAEDNHSVGLPSLICSYPLTAGKVVAEQWYQYQRKTANGALHPNHWENIPQASYLLTKEVYEATPGNWVLKFTKTNWSEHNPNHYHFEVAYKIGPKPATMPAIKPNSYTATIKKPKITANAAIYLTGAQTASFKEGLGKITSLEELRKLGFLHED